MALIDPILEELTREAETTRRVLTRLPADKLAFKPHVKSKSLGDLAWHLATIPGRIAAMAQVDDADALAFKAPPKPETPQAIVDGFDAGVREAKQQLAKLSDEQLGRKIRFRAGERSEQKSLAHLPAVGREPANSKVRCADRQHASREQFLQQHFNHHPRQPKSQSLILHLFGVDLLAFRRHS